MATLAAPKGVRPFSVSQPFFVKLAWALSIIIVMSFAQNAALGRVDIPRVPVWVHLHGVAMLAWLGLFITQNRLAAAGKLTQHRALGRWAILLVAILFALTCLTAIMGVAMKRFPPFFEAPFFLALALGEAVAFAGLVWAAIAARRDTEMHRRLMTGATIVLLEPAFGRVLPMPLLGGELGEWIIMGLQLAIVAVIAWHDRRTLGQIHRGTAWVAGVIAAVHVLAWLAAGAGPVHMLTAWVAGIA